MTIKPAIITKSQAAALEALKQFPEYQDPERILDAHRANPKFWAARYSNLNGMDDRLLRKALKFGYSTDVRVNRIFIQRVEGPTELTRIKHTAFSWEEARNILKNMGLTAPAEGYDKVDFKILFTNGDVYNGRYDLQQNDEFGGSLFAHVRSFCEFYAGLCYPLPDHIQSQAAYEEMIAESAMAYVKFLDDVLYPSAGLGSIDASEYQRIMNLPKPVRTNWTNADRKPDSPKFVLVIRKHEDFLFQVLKDDYGHWTFSTRELLDEWLQKRGLTIGKEIRKDVFHIKGTFQTLMITDRKPYLHLPQVAMLMNGSMVRAYKEVTPEGTTFYVVQNYPEAFKFDYNKPSGQWYLKKFFRR